MKRTRAILSIVLLGVVLGLWPLASNADTRPNVLLIAVDDLNDWVGFMGGHPQSVTPNLDRLAKQSTVFTNAHCQGTMCNPSRISFLWGMRPSTTGFYNNRYGVGKEKQFLQDHTSLPAYFRKHGYHTLTAGKIFHSDEPGKYSQVKGPRPGFVARGKDKFIHSDPSRWHRIWDFGPQDYAEEDFVDSVVASWGEKQFKQEMKKPFFMSVGFYRPHVPFFPPKRVYDAFGEVQVPPAKADDWDDIPEAAKDLTLSNPKIPTYEWMQQKNREQEAVRAYLACVNWVDEQIGRVINALDQSPYSGNTIVVLLSDHGYHLGEKQRWSKFSLWERTTRVPLIVRLPGRKPAATDAPVELLSVYPTLLELCGLPENEQLEGVSLVPLLRDPDSDWEHAAVTTLGQGNHAVRDRRWRYIRYADGTEELYDHADDKNEWHNLAVGDPSAELQKIIGRMKRHLPSINRSQRK